MHDVVIIGAGTAGCVLAERLSASGKLKVLLLEAGKEPRSSLISIPAAFAKLFNSEFDWALHSQPQIAVQGRRIFIPRGKMLGGCANLNAQIHQWGHPEDFNGWMANGANGWGWDDVRPTFRAQETWSGEDPYEIRGREGPMRISPNRHARTLSKAFVQAARKCGLGDQPSYNGVAYEGAWLAELSQYRGKRFSAYHAYLKPALTRKNLQVSTLSHAQKVLFENQAIKGVSIVKNGVEEFIRCRGVVVSAGTFGSPQLLVLSGIGPAETLKRLGIEVVCDAPEVGRNLQDHPILPLVFRTSTKDTFKRAEHPLSLLRYLLFKSGMLASPGAEAMAFTRVHRHSINAPDLELLLLPLDVRPHLLSPPEVDAFCIGVAVVAPRSRGRLKFSSKNSCSPPEIDLGLFTDGEGVDKEILLKGISLARKIADTAPLREFNCGELRPGPSAVDNLDAFHQLTTDLQTVYHPTSTCRMGSDVTAVVDPKLRVPQVQNLWIADASVMPTVPRGHPNAAVAMIAHRAAMWIEQSLTG